MKERTSASIYTHQTPLALGSTYYREHRWYPPELRPPAEDIVYDSSVQPLGLTPHPRHIIFPVFGQRLLRDAISPGEPSVGPCRVHQGGHFVGRQVGAHHIDGGRDHAGLDRVLTDALEVCGLQDPVYRVCSRREDTCNFCFSSVKWRAQGGAGGVLPGWGIAMVTLLTILLYF